MSSTPLQLRKYHGLGNDYLIPVNASDAAPEVIDRDEVRRLCQPHYGLGADGVLYGPYYPGSAYYEQLAQPGALCAFRIMNPDGSEAEKSGNGVRIFARWLFDSGVVKQDEPFVLATQGGSIRCIVHDPARAIEAALGQVSFDSAKIPVAGEPREVLHERINAAGQELEFCAATIGNPHCVVLSPEGVSEVQARMYGPVIECDKRFPNRTNVQFIQRVDEHHLRLEIFERGAGYTLASGTSAAAAAATAVRIGWCESPVTAMMPGGELELTVSADYSVTQCGPVTLVYEAGYWRP